MKGKRLVFAFTFLFVLGGLADLPSAAQDLLPASLGSWISAGAPTQVSAPQIEQLANERARLEPEPRRPVRSRMKFMKRPHQT